MNENDTTVYSDKKRLTYQLLALFLGGLGVHNFYAGRKGIAVIQLLITIAATIGISVAQGKLVPGGGPVALWALIEIFAVKKDGKGRLLKK